MLVLALVLLSGPVSQPAARPFPLPQSTVTVRAGDIGEVRTGHVTAGPQTDLCASGLRLIGPGEGVVRPLAVTGPTNAQPKVRMYHLLDRTIDGCRVPLIAIEHLPEADRAIGRNLGRVIDPR